MAVDVDTFGVPGSRPVGYVREWVSDLAATRHRDVAATRDASHHPNHGHATPCHRARVAFPTKDVRGIVKIEVMHAEGAGPTELSAFDDALSRVGMQDYNLITLSSIIPADSTVIRTTGFYGRENYGSRLYVVMSVATTALPGASIWAALGWTQRADGFGLFVEHVGATREDVVRDALQSLDSMAARRPGTFSAHEIAVQGAHCHTQPVCALSVAAFQIEEWN